MRPTRHGRCRNPTCSTDLYSSFKQFKCWTDWRPPLSKVKKLREDDLLANWELLMSNGGASAMDVPARINSTTMLLRANPVLCCNSWIAISCLVASSRARLLVSMVNIVSVMFLVILSWAKTRSFLADYCSCLVGISWSIDLRPNASRVFEVSGDSKGNESDFVLPFPVKRCRLRSGWEEDDGMDHFSWLWTVKQS